MNVLIAPTVDSRLLDHFWSVSGDTPSKASKDGKLVNDGTHLEPGDAINKYNALNIGGSQVSFLVRSIFSTLVNETFKTNVGKIDLSLTAPVAGQYFPGELYGPLYTGDYDPQQTMSRNPLPRTFNEARARKSSCAYSVVIPDSQTMTGEEALSSFFEKVKRNRRTLTSWLEGNQNYHSNGHNTSDLWRIVDSEQRRLSEVICPVIPYDGRDLG